VPAIGEVVLLVLGIMRVNKYKVIAVMAFGKFARYAFIAASFYGFSNLLK
jgi:membrane protein YqaA with SNARE-associated domain